MVEEQQEERHTHYKQIKGKRLPLSTQNITLIALAFVIVLLFYFLPSQEGLPHDAQVMIGILIMGGILWSTEPIPLPITGLLIMIIQPLLGVMSSKEVFSSFGNQAVFFLIGAFILAAAIEKHGLHRRIALRLLSFFEKDPKILSLGIMTSCVFLSFIMPEHGVAALFLPIVVSILVTMKIPPRKSNFGKICMLSVAYGCSIGSLGTLVGGARNPLTIGILSELDPPILVSFIDWMIYSVPIVLIALPVVWFILQFSFPIELDSIISAKREINNQVSKAGHMSNYELLITIILFLTIVLWVFFSSSQYFGLAVIALISSMLLFLSGCITWKDIEKRVPWGIILMYGGAITLSIGMQRTGAGAWIAHQLFTITGHHIILVVLGLIIFTILLTNVMSNVGAVAILLPIGISLASEIPSISPLFASMIVALSGGLAFMFVVATPGNAITYSSGYFSTKDLFRAGVFANVLCILIIFVIALVYWRGVLNL
jgi:sodium-dependent dicarboxylate transporter 2/3/5